MCACVRVRLCVCVCVCTFSMIGDGKDMAANQWSPSIAGQSVFRAPSEGNTALCCKADAGSAPRDVLGIDVLANE